MKIVALAGGVGGAKLADGLSRALPPEDLTIIVNTGDDFEHWGMKICPDLDTVCYTLAGIANPETGWGRANESWNTFDNIQWLGGDTWFRIGDRDLATHIERSRRLKNGQTLSEITAEFCQAWGIQCTILPMTNEAVPTIVDTVELGELAFQEYFVHQRCQPTVRGFRFDGIEKARPAPGVLEAIDTADAVIFCPSNPWVSIDPILSITEIGTALNASGGKTVVGVSPIIGGETVKGPAAKMFKELGITPSAVAVARHYGPGILNGFVIDSVDAEWADSVAALEIRPFVTNTLMKTPKDRLRLAEDVLHFLKSQLL